MGFLLDAMSPSNASTSSATWSRTSAARATRTGPTAWPSSSSQGAVPAQGHPYHWPTIGSLEDLTAASHRRRAGVLPHLLRAQQRQPRRSPATSTSPRPGRLVERWFSDVPGGKPVPPVAPPPAMLTAVTRKTHDRSRAAAADLPGVAHARADAPGRRRARRRRVAADQRQELAALQAAGLRPADRPGCRRLPAVAGARQRVLPAGDGPSRQDRRGAAEGHRRRDRRGWRRRRPSRARWSAC